MGTPTAEQLPVIENASANNMVIAAPGSGKSFTMIEAVISILSKYPYARIGIVDSIGQRNSYVKTWGCGGFLNETNIYSRGKSLCF